MIDLSTISSLELIQNLQDSKSRHSLLGLLRQTQTPMGMRFLRSNILQPSTDSEKLTERYEALQELSSKEEMFSAIRQGKVAWTVCWLMLTCVALHKFVDTDRILANVRHVCDGNVTVMLIGTACDHPDDSHLPVCRASHQ